MIQENVISKITKSLLFVYIGFMLVFYFGYIFLVHLRLSRGEKYLSQDYLSQGDIESIKQMAFWTTMFELCFIGLFVLASLLLYWFRKNKKIFTRFIFIHLSLFSAIFTIGYILSFFTNAPIGNLTQPLYPTSFLLLFIILCFVVQLIKNRFSAQY